MNKRRRSISRLVSQRLLLLLICVSSCCCLTSQEMPGAEPPAGKDSLVPDAAISGPWQANSAGGGINIRFDSFQKWLDDGGVKCKSVALNDDRLVSEVLHGFDLITPDRERWRVKDLAYQLMIRDPARAIRWGQNRQQRDELIGAYLDAISTPDSPALPATTTDLGTGAYRLPLVEPYAIYRAHKLAGMSAERGLYQLVEVLPSRPSSGLATRLLVPKVRKVAVRGRVIFGTAADGFFVLDVRQSPPRLEILRTHDEWETMLLGLGVSDTTIVKAPDELAAGVPAQVLRPWAYESTNRLGVSTDVLSLAIQLSGIALSFMLGLARRRRRSPVGAAVAIGVIVNIVAQVLIAGGGPGAFVGFVFLPLACLLAAALGKGLRKLACGYRPAEV